MVVDIYLALHLTHGFTVYGRVREPQKRTCSYCVRVGISGDVDGDELAELDLRMLTLEYVESV